MKTLENDLGVLETIVKDAEFNISYFSLELPNGESFEFELE
ncbi:hypothetical protein [Croceiramulus getboli]|nr:hypothetical protein P8624_05145 [Flavobacteriaceae bacterium YJPT1-3]